MPVLALPRSLEAPVTVLPRLYAAGAKRLARLGIETVRDLLLTLPYDWETYGAPAQVAGLDDGKQATVVGTVTSISAKQSLRRRIKLTERTIRDDEGAPLRQVGFNQPYIAKNLHKGDRVAVAGTVKSARYGGALQMQNPHYERLEDREDVKPVRVGGLMPKYHLVEGLSSRKIARWVEAALPLADRVEDVIPAQVRERNHLIEVAEAIRRGHKPEADQDFADARRRIGHGPRVGHAVGGDGADRDPGPPAPSPLPRLPGGQLPRPHGGAPGQRPARARAPACTRGRGVRPLRPRRGHARADRGGRRARQPRPRHRRRAASVRHTPARAAPRQRSGASALPGDDRDPDPAHPRARAVRRDVGVRPRRDAPRPDAGDDRGGRPRPEVARLRDSSSRGRRGTAGVRHLPAHRGVGDPCRAL